MRLLVRPATSAMNTSAARLRAFASTGAQAWTATISATIAGINRTIRISSIENHGSAIGLVADSSDAKPSTNVSV